MFGDQRSIPLTPKRALRSACKSLSHLLFYTTFPQLNQENSLPVGAACPAWWAGAVATCAHDFLQGQQSSYVTQGKAPQTESDGSRGCWHCWAAVLGARSQHAGQPVDRGQPVDTHSQPQGLPPPYICFYTVLGFK